MTQTIPIGTKVIVPGFEYYGFGEVASYPDHSKKVAVDFYRDPVQFERVMTSRVQYAQVPEQTRVFVPLDTGVLIGRIVGCISNKKIGSAIYHVALPNEKRASQFEETQFHVRSILFPADPVETLAGLAHETPFFFEQRKGLVTAYDRFEHASRGLQGLSSANVELFPHQAEAVRRVLQDPHVRYLLADEVGLGKTIEAGAILRQFENDSSRFRSLVLVPPVLLSQWESELLCRFRLERVTISTHSDIERFLDEDFDIVVIDEAHRLIEITSESEKSKFECLKRLSKVTPHLLLLSATPILHKDKEILALLHLLDPEQYNLNDLDGFQLRLKKRERIGRLLLALERASAPVIIRRQLELLKDELPDDEDVQNILAKIPQGLADEHNDAWREIATRVRILVAETWRIHRRLVRTRRSALLEEGEIQRLRHVEEPEYSNIYADNPKIFTELWEWIEELRTLSAAKVDSLPESDIILLRDGYLKLAYSVTIPEPDFNKYISEMRNNAIWDFAADILNQIESVVQQIPLSARLEALEAVLENPPKGESHWVIFCPNTKDALNVSEFLAETFENRRVFTLIESDAASAGIRLTAFNDSQYPAFLVVDKIAEEGLNLQIADAIVLLDLPFQPMRLEQRIGRLDRLNRTRPLRAIAIMSIDDSDEEHLAFDRAWYEIIVNGLGLFEESIADVPYLLERQMENLSELIFNRGPGALYEYVGTLKEVLGAERKLCEEQAVIDGTSIAGIQNAKWWKSFEDTDSDESYLAREFQGYIGWMLGMRLQSLDDGLNLHKSHKFVIGRDKRRDILLPMDRLLPLSELTGVPYTFNRKRAVHDLDVQLLRPGAPLLDWLRELADWDDRGRAFALWRKVPDFNDPQIIIRTSIVAELNDEKSPIINELDAVGRASLRRLTANWFVSWHSEIFLRIDCSPATYEEIEFCRPRYDSKFDENLGGFRAAELLSILGYVRWPELCRKLAQTAIEQTQQHPDFLSRISQAKDDAQKWFLRRETRLSLRESQGIAKDVDSERRILSMMQNHVKALLDYPQLKIDAIGVYILSADYPGVSQ